MSSLERAAQDGQLWSEKRPPHSIAPASVQFFTGNCEQTRGRPRQQCKCAARFDGAARRRPLELHLSSLAPFARGAFLSPAGICASACASEIVVLLENRQTIELKAPQADRRRRRLPAARYRAHKKATRLGRVQNNNSPWWPVCWKILATASATAAVDALAI